ncbi:VTA1-like protein (macronuclear) [Tetrahymena thermophila SB210]|uniref:VTA1-like protein n=1 Tax=Tetrahymena thermophila (strain SB210) TaxID=312017 RepID=Q22EF6_TETTS|nr:VTA1-like protein [Tetrahymena thermophila SB210]EAR83696.2 VTA1-like protein [Tetrahymena thermophila SB210]|eukprot:XP_001031359.2 VTA1-like protein [Tetrahymena thermophila SB210]
MDKEVLFIKPFLIYSQEVQQTNLVLAYYLKFYAYKKAGTICAKYQGQADTSYVQDMMNEWNTDLEQMKQQLGSTLQNTQQNKQQIVDYTLRIFAKCDHDERNGQFTKQTQQDFTMISRYLEMLAVFGPLDNDLNQKRIYAKSKAVEIKKKLDNPQQYPASNQQNNQSQAPQQYQPNNSSSNNNNNNYFGNTGNQDNNQNNNMVRQSVFNNIPQIINMNNLKQTANNFNDINIAAQPQAPPQSSNNQNKGNGMFTAPTKYVQFANPYLNQSVGFNIPMQEGSAKIIDLCQKAISELDFNQFSNAKEALKLALTTAQNIKN